MGTRIQDKFPLSHDFGGARVLNLGCGFGHFSAKNVTNLDAFGVCKPDVQHDLNVSPLPFEDETFDFIIANHIMEHIQNWWGCFNELARILKTGGKLEIWVPGSGSDSIRGFRDHIHEINNCSFFGVHGTYKDGSNAWAAEHARGWANRLVTIDQMFKLRNEPWLNHLPQRAKRWCAMHLRNVTVENGYRFEKIGVAAYEKEQALAKERADDYARRNTTVSL